MTDDKDYFRFSMEPKYSYTNDGGRVKRVDVNENHGGFSENERVSLCFHRENNGEVQVVWLTLDEAIVLANALVSGALRNTDRANDD